MARPKKVEHYKYKPANIQRANLKRLWINTNEACTIGGRSEIWVRHQLAKGNIHEKMAHKNGGRWMWNRLLVERFGIVLKSDPVMSDFYEHAYPEPEEGQINDTQNTTE